MCGIAGYIGKRVIDKGCINRTLSLMKKRGPDHQDMRVWEKDQKMVVLLHSRLSIIDLDPRSNQPFSKDGCHLIFNGEIYNFIEVRQELQGKGCHFKTGSDTEVLLQAYLTYGVKCVDSFEGMWSFAIYDERNDKVFLSRDRFAEKPLFYFEDNEGFYFASEVKFIKSLVNKNFEVNKDQLFRYLVNGYKSIYKHNYTFFDKIYELSYATNCEIFLDGKKQFERYWSPEVNIAELSLDQSIQGFRERLVDSVKLRLRADVPLAFCLSGGVDSASIVSIAAKKMNYNVSTFSIIDSDDRYNEYDNIMATVNDIDCEHTLIHLETNGTINRLRSLIDYHDSPLATISYYIHSFLSEAIAQKGYSVVCSGTAADELVTGYYDHYLLHLYEMRNDLEFDARKRDWEKHIRINVRNPLFRDPQLYMNDPGFRKHIYQDSEQFSSYLKNDFHEEFLEQDFGASLLRNRMLNEMFHEVTPVILHEDDHNSMFYSIENRSPFLDLRLFEFSNSIPSKHLIMDGYNKYVLRESVSGILNDQVRCDRKKKGFNASINSIIDVTDCEQRDFILSDSGIYDFVKKEMVENLLDQKLPYTNTLSKFLFNFINVKIFLELNK